MRLSVYVPLLAAIPSLASAEPLSFDVALERAAANAPVLEARNRQIQARQSSAIAAGRLPDPTLGVGIDNFPVSGPPAFSLTEENMTMERVGIEQAIPNLAKRHAEQGRARADIGAAEAQGAGAALQVKVATAAAWIDLAYARKRLETMDGILARLRPLVPASTSAVASGSARPGQSLNAEQALIELEDRRSTIAAEVGSARAELTRWTGDGHPEPIGSVPDFDLAPAALRARLGEHPDLRMASAEVGQAMADVEMARAGKRPDWGLNMAFQRRDPRFGNMVSVGATMSLPIFPGRRQNPRIDAALAEVAAARAEQEDMRRALAAQLEAGLAEHAMHHEQWMRARDTLLPLARRKVELERASYSAGRAGLLDVIEAEAALATIELDTLDREAAVARHAARLALTFGGDGQ
ncbi:TolC family protein [Novosphingobium mathurense]|uniref:Outer membrane protein TolC n=1 Tax=Novosphingobium mathurense TaxID=428990 RepID=A0A1U6ID84_9SPHN|nr:TolC family protein [Novosphingobium mathurense]SLK05943.1 Outer membrane protein TolC [Novosphingobium mathurense]HKY82787.1 TolC family protein [Sphingobium sp.]